MSRKNRMKVETAASARWRPLSSPCSPQTYPQAWEELHHQSTCSADTWVKCRLRGPLPCGCVIDWGLECPHAWTWIRSFSLAQTSSVERDTWSVLRLHRVTGSGNSCFAKAQSSFLLTPGSVHQLSRYDLVKGVTSRLYARPHSDVKHIIRQLRLTLCLCSS